MAQPEVTVVIGAYEAMPYLVERLASLEAQTIDRSASRSSPSTTARRTARGSAWRSSRAGRPCRSP
ncbi:hypothetical protein ACR6C2_15730 [Streptomyces sp. INA 01156]